MLSGAGSSADITSCITQAENCMSLLLSDDVFNLAADPAKHDRNSGTTAASSHRQDCERLDTNEGHDELVDSDSQFQTECKDVGRELSVAGEGFMPLTNSATSHVHDCKNNESKGLDELVNCDNELRRDANCGVLGECVATSNDELITSSAADADMNEERSGPVSCESELQSDHRDEISAAGRSADETRSSDGTMTDVDVIDREETNERLDVNEGCIELVNCKTESQPEHRDAECEVSAAGGSVDEVRSIDEPMASPAAEVGTNVFVS